MQQEEIEIQLWEYIDGDCDAAEHERIAVLIQRDVQWKQVYGSLLAFHDDLHKELVPLPASAVFTEQVMGKIATPAKSNTYKALNLSIKAVACFFILAVTGLLGYSIYNTNWDFKTTQYSLPKFNWDNISIPVEFNVSPSVVTVVSFTTVLFTLLLADNLFRKRLTGRL